MSWISLKPISGFRYFGIGLPSFHLYAGVSSFETSSPASKSGQSWRLKIFPSVPPLVFRLMMKKFQGLSFGTPFKKFSPAWTPKRVSIPTLEQAFGTAIADMNRKDVNGHFTLNGINMLSQVWQKVIEVGQIIINKLSF